MNKLAELFFRDLINELCGGKIVKINKPEVDIAITKFNKLKLVGEVKFGKIEKEDILKTISNLKDFNCNRIFIVRDKKEVEKYKDLLGKHEIKTLDIFDLIKNKERIKQIFQ